VSTRVAARWLELDEDTVRKFLDSGVLGYSTLGRRRRIEVVELVAFEQRNRRSAR